MNQKEFQRRVKIVGLVLLETAGCAVLFIGAALADKARYAGLSEQVGNLTMIGGAVIVLTYPIKYLVCELIRWLLEPLRESELPSEAPKSGSQSGLY